MPGGACAAGPMPKVSGTCISPATPRSGPGSWRWSSRGATGSSVGRGTRGARSHWLPTRPTPWWRQLRVGEGQALSRGARPGHTCWCGSISEPCSEANPPRGRFARSPGTAPWPRRPCGTSSIRATPSWPPSPPTARRSAAWPPCGGGRARASRPPWNGSIPPARPKVARPPPFWRTTTAGPGPSVASRWSTSWTASATTTTISRRARAGAWSRAEASGHSSHPSTPAIPATPTGRRRRSQRRTRGQSKAKSGGRTTTTVAAHRARTGR